MNELRKGMGEWALNFLGYVSATLPRIIFLSHIFLSRSYSVFFFSLARENLAGKAILRSLFSPR